jgi:hypothetical protein
MINHYNRTPIKIDEARLLADVITEISGGLEPELVVKAALVIELHHHNQHMARIVEALDNLMSK